jgi:hypothetical protein
MRARLRRAVRDTERAARRRDLLMVQAHAEGMSYNELARVAEWDRKSLTRHLARVRAAFMAELEHAKACSVAGTPDELHGAEAWDFLYVSAERAEHETWKASK